MAEVGYVKVQSLQGLQGKIKCKMRANYHEVKLVLKIPNTKD